MVYRQTDKHTDALITNLQYFATLSGVYGFCRPTAATTLTANIIDCVEAATSCMRSNRLRPNPDKTEFLCCASVRRQHQLPINVTAADRRLLHHSGPVCSRPRHLRRLRFVEADACSTYRVALLCCATSSTSDTSLCTVGHTATLQMLVVALVHSRLDYGNGVLVGLPAHLMRRLQWVLNAAARLIYRWGPRPHNWCSHQSALVAGSGTNSVQAGYSGVQSSTRRCTTLAWSADPRRQLARTTTNSLYQHQPSRGTASEAVSSWQPSFCG